MRFFLFLGMLLAVQTPDLVTPEESKQLSEIIQMPGVDRFVSQQLQQKLVQEMNNKVVEWSAESLHQLLHPSPDAKPVSLREIFAQNPELSKQLKIEIQKKLEAWLPQAAEKGLNQLLGQNGDIREIKEEVVKVLNTSIKDQIDGMISPWYDSMIAHALQTMNLRGFVSIDDFSSLFRGALRPDVGSFLSQKISDAIGQATVRGLQNNILKPFGGKLPNFQDYKQYLPSAQFAKLKDKAMGLHIVDMPNQAYGGILAASAAMHFVKAFAGMHINFYELKRGKEVTETLVWQLRNKQYVSFNLGDFVGMVKMLGDQVGSFHWGALKQMAKWNPANQFTQKLDWMDKQLRKIDTLYDKTTGKVQEGFENVVGDLRKELQGMSDELLGPLKEVKLPCLTSEGCPNLFPAWADKTPLNYLKKFYSDSGLKKTLKEVNQKMASVGASAAVTVSDALHITGPLAEILKVEKVPPQNPSQDSDFDPVFLHNGEFYLPVTDVTLPGKNASLQFTRIYRSQSPFLGALGYNWTHNFAERLLWLESPDGEGYTYVDAAGKKYFFKKTAESFESPPGLFLTLQESDAGFALQDSEGGTHQFNKEGFLTKIRSAEGEEQAVIYDERGILSRVENSDKHDLRFFYQPDGLLERVEDFTGRIWKFDYNKDHELIAATSPGTPDFPKGKTSRYHYDQHRLILIMDPKGQIFLQNFYGASGENFGKVMLQKYGNESASIEARYDGLNTWVKDRRGVMHLYEHDEEGHLRQHKIVKENGSEKILRAFEYNRDGLRTAEIFSSGLKMTSEWKDSKLISQTIVAKDGENLPISIAKEKPQEANRATYQYDLWGNITAITDATGKTRQLEVDASNLITKEIVDGETRLYRYDANDNIIRMEVPQKHLRVELEYDILDRLTAKKEFLSGEHPIITRYEYDPEGRLTKFIYPLGNEDRFVYDDEGHLIQKTRGFGSLEQSTEHYKYNEDGGLVATIDGEGNKTQYFYDPFGRNTSSQSPMGNKTKLVLDEESRILEKQQLNAEQNLLAKEKWEYKDDKVAKYLRYLFRDKPSRGKWVELSLRGADAPKQSPAASDGLPTITQRDSLNRPTQIEKTKLEWDDNGRLASLTAESGETTTYAYDSLNRLVLEHYPNNTEIKYAYDNVDRVVGKTDRNGNALRFEYNEEGEVVLRLSHQAAQSFVYDGLGRLLLATDFNKPDDSSDDIKTEFLYDSFSREIGESLNGRWVYKSYDKNGNKTSIDYASKLQVVRQLDADGKMHSAFVEGREFLIPEIVPDSFSLQDTAAPVTVERSRADFLANHKNLSYHYDDWDRLIAVENANHETIAQYVYDVFGRVARKESEELSYDDWETLEIFSEGKPKESIVYADILDTPLLLKNHGAQKKYFYHQDQRGSVRFLTDEAGEKVEFYDYSLFGKMEIHDEVGNALNESQFGNSLGFIARPFDNQTGLVNLRMRYYAPELQQFISPDPLGYKNEFYSADSIFTPRNFSYHQGQGKASRTTYPNFVQQGDETLLLDTDLFFENRAQDFPAPEMNLFAYANNDPLNFYDPFGLYFIDVQLPVYGKRDNYGLLRLYNNEEQVVSGPFRVLGRSSNSWPEKGKTIINKNKTRNPLYQYGDTPPGMYLISQIEKERDKGKYGPNEVIRMDPLFGNAKIAEKNGRSGLLIHGGRSNPAHPFGDGLASTQGCVRMHDGDIAILIQQINRLKQSGDAEGSVMITEHSLTDIRKGEKP